MYPKRKYTYIPILWLAEYKIVHSLVGNGKYNNQTKNVQPDCRVGGNGLYL